MGPKSRGRLIDPIHLTAFLPASPLHNADKVVGPIVHSASSHRRVTTVDHCACPSLSWGERDPGFIWEADKQGSGGNLGSKGKRHCAQALGPVAPPSAKAVCFSLWEESTGFK